MVEFGTDKPTSNEIMGLVDKIDFLMEGYDGFTVMFSLSTVCGMLIAGADQEFRDDIRKHIVENMDACAAKLISEGFQQRLRPDNPRRGHA